MHVFTTNTSSPVEITERDELHKTARTSAPYERSSYLGIFSIAVKYEKKKTGRHEEEGDKLEVIISMFLFIFFIFKKWFGRRDSEIQWCAWWCARVSVDIYTRVRVRIFSPRISSLCSSVDKGEGGICSPGCDVYDARPKDPGQHQWFQFQQLEYDTQHTHIHRLTQKRGENSCQKAALLSVATVVVMVSRY